MAHVPTSPLPDVVAAVVAAYRRVPEVVAVAIAGSVATDLADDRADIDLYVYAAEPIAIPTAPPLPPASPRAPNWATPAGNQAATTNGFTAKLGRHIDITYRRLGWIEEQLNRMLVRHEASVGYSTCVWHNVLHSAPLYDQDGWYRALQASAKCPYPELLKRAIVAKNHPILRRRSPPT